MNKKRIFLIIFIVILLGLLVYSSKELFLGKKFNLFGKSVKGISTQKQENVSLPSSSKIQNSLQQRLESIKQEASKIDIAEIASSSPQIQKLIKDLNSLKDYPSNQIKQACQNICNSL